MLKISVSTEVIQMSETQTLVSNTELKMVAENKANT